MKYKLINNKTKEEHLCDKVAIDGFDYYVSDEEIFIGNWYFLPRTNSLYQCNEDPTELNLERKVGIKKVIATNNTNIDLPKVVDVFLIVEQWVKSKEKLVYQYWDKPSFIEGYNKAKETYTFSEEDMIEFGKHCIRQFAIFQNRDGNFIKRLLPEWKENKPKIVYYE